MAKFSRKNDSAIERQARLCYLRKQRKADAKSIEDDKKQEAKAHAELEEHCRQNPSSKFMGDFQACIKEHNVWLYLPFLKNARWARETPRKDNGVDGQNKKFDFGSWYKRKYNDYTCGDLYSP